MTGGWVGLNQIEAAIYVQPPVRMGRVAVGLMQKQYIIKGMTCRTGFHLVYHNVTIVT